jgi:hypothetical protein
MGAPHVKSRVNACNTATDPKIFLFHPTTASCQFGSSPGILASRVIFKHPLCYGHVNMSLGSKITVHAIENQFIHKSASGPGPTMCQCSGQSCKMKITFSRTPCMYESVYLCMSHPLHPLSAHTWPCLCLVTCKDKQYQFAHIILHLPLPLALWSLVTSYPHAGMPHTQGGWVSIFPCKKGRLPKVPNKYWPNIGVEHYFKISSMKKLNLSELKVI